MNDAPIHLTSLSICKREEHAEPSVTIPVWVTQSSLDGMNAIIRVIEGLQLAGKGQLSGGFELAMFYRTLQSNILQAETEAREREREKER